MRKFLTISLLSAVASLAASAAVARADALLSIQDHIIPIDLDMRPSSADNAPDEGIDKAIDGDWNTKYLNWAGAGSGLILIPAAPTEVHSITLVTAFDYYMDRDPRTFELYGKVDSTVSTPPNGYGDEDTGWVKLAEGALILQWGRPEGYTIFNLNTGDTTAYGAYKLVFPRLMGQLCEWEAWRELLQIDEIEFYASPDGTGTNVALSLAGASAIAINPRKFSAGGWTRDEGPTFCLDSSLETKFDSIGCNNGNVQDAEHSGTNSGFIVTPFAGPTIVTSLQIATGNDDPTRDPQSWELYGTNDPIQSEWGSFGDQESWTLIASGTGMNLPDDRGVWAAETAPFANTTAYTSYKFVVTELKGPGDVACQYSEIQFFGTKVGAPLGIKLDTTDALVLAVDEDPPPYLALCGDELREGPGQAVDGNASTKYLAWGGWGASDYAKYTGLIITLPGGPAAVQSLGMVTANDAPERDPVSFELYGTNDPIVDLPNSAGDGETWTLVATGALNLPEDRFTRSTVTDLVNSTTYASYRIVFPEMRGTQDNCQFSEVELYASTDATGTNVALGGAVVNVDLDDAALVGEPASAYSGDNNEGPSSAFDGDVHTKYLNGGNVNYSYRGGRNSGLIIRPAASSVLIGFRLTNANDDWQRDPASYRLYGTNEEIADGDNSQGIGENWTLISEGSLNPNPGRFERGPIISFANDTLYASYKLIFPTVRDPLPYPSVYGMQIAELELFVKPCPTPWADADSDQDVDLADFAIFQSCFGASGALSWQCACLDQGGGSADSTINAADLTAFMDCWSGPSVLWTAAPTPCE